MDAWISVDESLPNWYVPVLCLHDGDDRTNPFPDKMTICARHDMRIFDYNHGFNCAPLVFYWLPLPDVPKNFLGRLRDYHASGEFVTSEE